MRAAAQNPRRRRRSRLAVAAALVVVLAGVGWLADIGWNSIVKTHVTATTECLAVGPAEVYSMQPDQLLNASKIADVAMRRNLPQRALIVALATAQQESKLENLDYGDADSVGLFQQRPSQGWGTKTQILDPAYAAGKFFDALLKVPGWQQLPVTEAASTVQRNAYPDAYKDWEPRATALAGALTGTTTGRLTCRLVRSGVLATAATSATSASPTPGAATVSTAGLIAASANAVISGLRTDLDINHPTLVATDAKRTTITLTGLGDIGSGDDAAAKHRTATVAAWAIAHAAADGITSVVVGDQEWRPARAEWRPAETPAPAGAVTVTVGLTSN